MSYMKLVSESRPVTRIVGASDPGVQMLHHPALRVGGDKAQTGALT